MAKLSALFSSSKANCTFISSKYGNLLVDFGGSLKATAEALTNAGSDISNIDAVLITHEHSDHIKGLKAFTNKYNVPIVSSAKTFQALVQQNAIGKNAVLKDTESLDVFNGIKITRFSVSHDCVDPGGYRIDFENGTSAAVCTDLGVVTETVRKSLKGCNAVLIESNHDINMLNNGPYPPELKLRIAGEKGHISNNTCSAELKNLLNSGTDRFILGHLSENNNTPILALSSAENALMDIGAEKDSDYLLSVALPCGIQSVFF